MTHDEPRCAICGATGVELNPLDHPDDLNGLEAGELVCCSWRDCDDRLAEKDR